MLEKELAIKGWNWGSAKFNGSILSFDIGSLTAFEIPLNNVSQCTTGKNEVTLEFHQVIKEKYILIYTAVQQDSFTFNKKHIFKESSLM